PLPGPLALLESGRRAAEADRRIRRGLARQSRGGGGRGTGQPETLAGAMGKRQGGVRRQPAREQTLLRCTPVAREGGAEGPRRPRRPGIECARSGDGQGAGGAVWLRLSCDLPGAEPVE